jgi:arylsulfatase A-like enzyme/cytochrome c peroxidase/PKD repeat protein
MARYHTFSIHDAPPAILVAAAILSLSGVDGGAGTISVNFTGSGSSTVQGPAGVMFVSEWNNLAGGDLAVPAALKDYGGNATPASLAFSSAQSGLALNNAADSENAKLYDGQIFAIEGGDDASVSIRSIPYTKYDVIVYYGHGPTHENKTVSISDGAMTFFAKNENLKAYSTPVSFTPVSTTNAPGSKGNYVVFEDLSDLHTTITLAYFDGRSGISGLQIIATFTDLDGDGLDDDWEILHFQTIMAYDADDNPDGDGLDNLEESARRTNPLNPDSDNDGLTDDVETNTGVFIDASDTGTDPLDPNTDDDRVKDGSEVNRGYNPVNPADSPYLPNVIIILADDLGWGEIGAFGQEKIRTPRLDQMAAEGMKFTRFYASAPVCAPTRCQMLTGKHAGHAVIRSNTDLNQSGYQTPLPEGEFTLGHLMQNAGYVTSCIGKWALGGPGTSGIPNLQGFDHFFGFLGQIQAHHYYPSRLWRNEQKVYYSPTLAASEGGALEIAGSNNDTGFVSLITSLGNKNNQGNVHAHDAMTAEALQWIQSHQNEAFFLYLPYTVPHLGIQPPAHIDDLTDADGIVFDNTVRSAVDEFYFDLPFGAPISHPGTARYTPTPDMRHEYAAMISAMDRDIGRIFDLLDTLDLDKDTLVIFTSDNGPSFAGEIDTGYFESTGFLRGVKNSLLEGGIRVPMIARWTGQIQPGSTTSDPATITELFPTLAELTGESSPTEADGVSLLPTLIGAPACQEPQPPFYWEHTAASLHQAVRMGPWKMWRNGDIHEGASIALYNLDTDPFELQNVASSNPMIVADLEHLMATEHTMSASPEDFLGNNEFPVLFAVTVGIHSIDFELTATDPAPSGGFVMSPLKYAVTSDVRFTTGILMQDEPTMNSNGFVFFLNASNNEDTVFVELNGDTGEYILSHGANSAAFPFQPFEDPYRVFDLEIEYSPTSGVVMVSEGTQTFQLALSAPLTGVTHVGYGVRQARTAFRAAETTLLEPPPAPPPDPDCNMVELIASRLVPPPGPGMANMAHATGMLFQVISRFNESNGVPPQIPGKKKFGTNVGSMHNGYFVTTFAPDSGGGPGGFLFYDVFDPYNPVLVNQVYEPNGRTEEFRESHAFGFCHDKNRKVIVLHTGKGIEFWDLADTLNPVQLSKLALPNVNFGDYVKVAWQIYWQAPYVYVAASNQGIYIVDASDPTAPHLVDRGPGNPNPISPAFLGGFRVGPIFAMGNMMLISSMGRSFAGFSVLDISNPIHPRLVSTTPIVPHQYYSTCFNGNHVTFSARMDDGRMFMYNVQDPVSPILEPIGPAIARQLYCTFQDDFIFQGCQSEVVKLDISDAAAPQIVGRGDFGVTDPDHGQVTAIGNILYAGNDHGTDSGFFVHQVEPDTEAPQVRAVNPAPNATGEALCSRVGLSFSDNIQVSSVDDDSFIVRPVGGNPLSGKYSVWLAIANFAPDDPLEPNTTYEVVVPVGGIKDWMGNPTDLEFISSFTTGTTCPGPPATPPDGLVSQWLLDGNADDNVGANHGTVSGAVFDLGALVFDGTNDTMTVTEPLHTHLGGTASLLFWLHTMQNGNDNFRAAPGIAGVAAAIGADDIVWGWLDASGHIGVQGRDGPPAQSNTPVNDGQWHHIGLTRNAVNGQVAVYVDGVLHEQVVGQLGNNAIPFDSFGVVEDLFSAADYFAGSLDDIRIYNRVLAGDEIAAIYNGLGVSVTSRPPRAVGQTVELTAEGSGTGTFYYSWDFGDGSPVTGWSLNPVASHVYGSPGHYAIILSVSNVAQSTSISFLQTIHRPLTVSSPSASSTIVHDGTQVLCVNEDNDTVTALEETTLTKIWEQPTGAKPRTLTVGPDNAIWVVNQDSATISRHHRGDGSLLETLPLRYGSAPYGIVVSPDQSRVFVTLEGSGEILRLSTNGVIEGSAQVGATPRSLAVSADGTRVLVTRLISPDTQGEVLEIDPDTLAVVRTIALPLDQTTVDSSSGARGLPNYLRSVSISPDGTEAWVTAKKDNIERGEFRDTQPLTFETSVRSLSSRIDMTGNVETVSSRIDHDDRGQPAASIYTIYGDYAFVALEGSNEIEIRDAYNSTTPGGIVLDGLAPRGLATNADGSLLFVHCFMTRSVVVYDIADVTSASGFSPTKVGEVQVVGNERLSPEVLLGKQIFYNGADDRMSRDDYISCASCHLDGGQDGRTWDFTDRGEGLRNTTTLLGRAGLAHGPVHWTGNFDEIQDFEHDIRNAFDGTGFLSDTNFHTGTRDQPLGDPKAGLSAELDALAAYLGSLTNAPSSPHRNADGELTADAQIGREVFAYLDCRQCHEIPTFTDSEIGLWHDVGTLTSASGERLGQTLTGIDTPGLAGVWSSPPYFHDGSVATIEDVLDGANSNQVHGSFGGISTQQVQQLVAFVKQIESSRDLRPIDLWRHDYMSLSQSLDPQIRDDMADPDLDGAENVMEYALGRNPMLSDWVSPLRLDLKNAVVTLERSATASGVSLHLEKAHHISDPLQWHNAEYPVLLSLPGVETETDVLGITQEDILRDALHFRLRLEWE